MGSPVGDTFQYVEVVAKGTSAVWEGLTRCTKQVHSPAASFVPATPMSQYYVSRGRRGVDVRYPRSKCLRGGVMEGAIITCQ